MIYLLLFKASRGKGGINNMIIYRRNIENGTPIYEIITKTFKTITIKCDETFNKYEIYQLLSLLENDVDNMPTSYSYR